MKVLYCRVSSLDQKTDRQKVNEKEFDYTIEDKCSGAVPFFERPGGKDIMKLIKKESLTSLAVYSIDRLGRDLRDILNTIDFFTNKKIAINFLKQSLSTLDADGNVDGITTMMISMLGAVGQMERTQIRERQLEGIKIAKAKGIYKGRVTGSKENVLAFLSKPKNKQALTYLDRGMAAGEAAKLAGVHINTITKIKKVAQAAK